jgi:hypothetical protein
MEPAAEQKGLTEAALSKPGYHGLGFGQSHGVVVNRNYPDPVLVFSQPPTFQFFPQPVRVVLLDGEKPFFFGIPVEDSIASGRGLP